MKQTTPPINFSYNTFNGDVEQLFALDKANDDYHWSKSNFSGNHFITVAEYNQQIVGFIVYTHYDVIEILRIVVAKEFRGLGIAKQLIASLGDERIILEVRKDNQTAISVYRKCSFQEVRVRKKYYTDGTDAIVMQKNIKK
jgi:ribosomal-protein-alanine N-acetyltransferase